MHLLNVDFIYQLVYVKVHVTRCLLSIAFPVMKNGVDCSSTCDFALEIFAFVCYADEMFDDALFNDKAF